MILVMKQNKITKDQQGMVSIIVTMIIMVVLGLIVLGFAQLSRREQRQSLDSQLAVQAQYAAESGINQAADYVRKIPATNWSDCDDSNVAGFNPLLKNDIKFTCVLINSSLDSLEYRANAGESSVFPIKPESGNLTSINISWTDDSLTNRNYVGCTSNTPTRLPAVLDWNCDAAMLQVDLLPIAPTYTSATLANNTISFFLKPINGSSSTTISSMPASGDIHNVSCSIGATPRDCRVDITVANPTGYYARIQRHYRSANVRISSSSAGQNQKLTEAQAEIDVTAKSSDVLKRLSARVSINPSNDPSKTTIPNSAIHTGQSLCKRLEIVPAPSGGTITYGDTPDDLACRF